MLIRTLLEFFRAPTHQASNFLLISSKVSPNFLSCINVSRAITIRLVRREERDDADKDWFYGMHGHPPFSRVFVTILVVTRCMENRNANNAIRVDVRMPHRGDETHLRWQQRELSRERQSSLKKTSFVHRVSGTDQQNLPFIQVVIINKSCGESLNGPFRQLLKLAPQDQTWVKGRSVGWSWGLGHS